MKEMLSSIISYLLILCVVFPRFGYGQGQDERVNHALKKPTRTSGHLEHCEDEHAVDGIHENRYISNSNIDNWLVIDLATFVNIEEILIYNREDCCQERLENAVITVLMDPDDTDNNTMIVKGSHKITADESQQSVISITFSGIPTMGRFLRISQKFEYLQLSEVEVYGTLTIIEGLPNIASHQLTSSSKMKPENPDYYGIDGNLDTFVHSTSAVRSFWYVDLASMSEIRQVTIYNRFDCCKDRLMHAVLTIRGNNFELITHRLIVSQGEQEDVFVITFPEDTRGRFVVIEQANHYLHFTQLEVYGTPATVGYSNIAYQKPTSTNKYFDGYESYHAVDGNTASTEDSLYHSKGKNAWWAVDLHQSRPIRQITIYNRADCCQERLIRANLYILDDAGHVTYHHVITEQEVKRSDVLIYDFPELPDGRIVRLNHPFDFLHFAEVEVWGT